jgi:acetyl-CoA carboxylase carboxyltransferase component
MTPPALVAQLDPRSEALRANAARMAERSIAVRALEAKVAAESESKRARFEQRGPLPPGERVARLLDRGRAFLELSALAGLGMHDDDGRKSVQGGASIVGVEAMKMELWLAVRCTGRVTAVHTVTKAKVEAGRALVEIETQNEENARWTRPSSPAR